MTTAWTPDIVTPDLARAVHYTLLWGLEGVALRTVGGAADRVPFVNEAALRHRLAEAELPVVAVDPGLFEGPTALRAGWLNDLDALDDTVRFCRRTGCAVVRVGALADGPFDRGVAAEALRRAAAVAASGGVRLAVRNEAGSAVATGADLAALLEAADADALGADALGADWRPADALQAGEDPADGLQALLNVGIACVGVRDVRPEAGGWGEATVGEGAVGWDDHLGALAEAGYAGPLVLDALPAPAASHGLAAATALIHLERRVRC
ncbi:MAG: TIM barrel protein [Bacteroidota bacterium]